jgi:hypothetical protein
MLTVPLLLTLLLILPGPVEAGEPGPFTRLAVDEVRRVVSAELKRRGAGEGGLVEGGLLKDGDIEIPTAVPVRAGSSLRVASVCWDGSAERARFRLECATAGACLPFFVYVRTASHAGAAACDLEAERRGSGAKGNANAAPMVRVGEGATAVMVGSGLRMTAAVTCLDRGARGEIIRVRGGEGRVFRARVAGPGLVEAVVSGNLAGNSAGNSEAKSE